MSFLDILKASAPMPKALEEEFEGRRASFEEKCAEDVCLPLILSWNKMF